jgi:hypothetical protein
MDLRRKGFAELRWPVGVSPRTARHVAARRIGVS